MKVLIIDDHALVRDGLFQLLPSLQQGFRPLGAATCEEAFEVLESNPEVGLILMDLGLPGISGTDGIRAVRERYPEIPLVALSGNQDRDVVLSAIKSGAMGFIPKSYNWERMSAALHYIVLQKGIFLPPEVMHVESYPSSGIGAQGDNTQPWEVASIRTTPPQKGVDPRTLRLTERQVMVLQRILMGKPNKAIARDLGIELATVRTHVSAVLRALNVTTRTEAVVKAHELGLVFESAR